MDRDNLVAIIENHYEGIIKNIDDQEANINLNEETVENKDFVQMRIKQDKEDIIAEIKDAKKANLEQLDSKIDEINSIASDESIQQEEKIKKIKRILFEKR